MKEALLQGDFRRFSDCLLNGCWLAKKNSAASIINEFLDELYQYAIDNGTESAKIFGTGGGGFMMIFSDPCRPIKLIRALKKRMAWY